MANHKTKTKKTALITGASGFIGSHLAISLIKKGWNVCALIRSSTDTSWLEDQNIRLIRGDYTDRESLEKAAIGIEYVFHLGALINSTSREDLYKANTLATGNLLEAFTKNNCQLKRFVFVSSIAAAGPSEKGVQKDEKAPCNPFSLYGKSKLEAEKITNQFRDRLPVVIIRPPNVLGTGQRELTSTLKLLDKRIVPMLGNGDKQTSISFVKDIVNSLILAAENDKAIGETYFVTDNHEYSWRELLEAMLHQLGKSSFAIKIPYPFLYIIGAISELFSLLLKTSPLITRKDIISANKNYWLFRSRKIEEELGFKSVVEFKHGIKEIVTWFRTGKDQISTK